MLGGQGVVMVERVETRDGCGQRSPRLRPVLSSQYFGYFSIPSPHLLLHQHSRRKKDNSNQLESVERRQHNRNQPTWHQHPPPPDSQPRQTPLSHAAPTSAIRCSIKDGSYGDSHPPSLVSCGSVTAHLIAWHTSCTIVFARWNLVLRTDASVRSSAVGSSVEGVVYPFPLLLLCAAYRASTSRYSALSSTSAPAV